MRHCASAAGQQGQLFFFARSAFRLRRQYVAEAERGGYKEQHVEESSTSEYIE